MERHADKEAKEGNANPAIKATSTVRHAYKTPLSRRAPRNPDLDQGGNF